MGRSKIIKFTGSFIALLLLSWLIGIGAEKLVIEGWDVEDSSVIKLETLKLSDVQPEGDENWRSQGFDLFVTFLSGEGRGRSRSVKVEELEGSHMKLIPGGKYIIVRDYFPDGTSIYSVSDRFRMPWVVSFLVFSGGTICLFAGWTGFRALMGLLLSLLVLIKGFLPGVLLNYPPVPLAVLSCAMVGFFTVFLVVRRPSYRPIAFLGALGGAVAASALGWFAVELWQLTGIGTDGGALFASTFPGYDVKGIFLASVIIGAIGAVLDVSISVTSSMAEMVDYDNDIPLTRLWKAGIGVGQEILGSMINTLILAYFGSSLILSLLIYNARPELYLLLNDQMFSQELVQSLAGTMGLLLTVPLTALIGVWWIGWLRKQRTRA